MNRSPLTADEIAILDTRLPAWACDGASLARDFTFAEFSEAFRFMTRVAEVAESLDHHPDWKNVYKTVEVSLSTHDAGGLTELDFKLAKRMDAFAAAISPPSGHS